MFTLRKNVQTYAFYLYGDEKQEVKRTVLLPLNNQDIARVDLVAGAEDLSFTKTGEGIEVELPEGELTGGAPIAHVFRIS